ncbi:phosphatidylinositol/phosphatidylcholine transfer protein SFH8-like [Apium graveolens]|uniref:phosphatidylinositol/phosphatidylcholine transfer protein SFH8-like n=1 Tax=Apium graveolens TaxID=4045 RepID=UPI003D7AC356
MIDKAVDAVWKRQAFLKKPNASGELSGTPASSVIQKAPKGYHVWIMEILMTFFITLYKLLHSVASRVTKKLPEKSSDQNISPQEFAFDTMPRKEIFPSLSTPTSTETDLLSSVLKRLGELEEIVDTLKAKPSEMPYEKEELLNVVVCRVDALEAELISTKKLIIRSHEGPDATEKRPGFGGMNEGYTIDHVVESGKLITLFSAPDYPQFQLFIISLFNFKK